MEKSPFRKDEILGLIKTNMRCRVKAIKMKSKIISLEIMMHDEYIPTTDNIDDFEFNTTQDNYSSTIYYQSA